MKTENELIEDFWISQGGKPHWKPDLSFYESSWDWLMPVVEKIRPLVCEIDTDSTVWRRLSGKSIFAKLEDVYKAVVEFIRWYNSQNS